MKFYTTPRGKNNLLNGKAGFLWGHQKKGGHQREGGHQRGRGQQREGQWRKDSVVSGRKRGSPLNLACVGAFINVLTTAQSVNLHHNTTIVAGSWKGGGLSWPAG